MIVGFNTDAKYRNEVFHIQTEDKGKNNPTIETLVYHNGEIMLSRRISYAHLKSKKDKDKEKDRKNDLMLKIKEMMKSQHDQVINDLKEGRFMHLLSMETQIIDDQSLDEMVIAYLNDLSE